MSKRHLATGGTAVVLVAFLVTSAALGSNRQAGVTIKAADKGQTYVINRSVTDRMFFSPGSISVKSGLDFDVHLRGNAGTSGSRTRSRSSPERTFQERPTHRSMRAKTAGTRSATQSSGGWIRNPKAPARTVENDIAHWSVDHGKPGLDGPGDSIAIEGAKHRSISIKVTAPAGTKLSFFCVVHPWMHGTITVT